MTDIIVKDIKNGSEYYYGGSAEVSAEDVSYDNSSSGATADNIQDAMDEVFQSVSNGKGLIADAITDKGVSTSASDSFQTMASNISSLNIKGDVYNIADINNLEYVEGTKLYNYSATANSSNQIYSINFEGLTQYCNLHVGGHIRTPNGSDNIYHYPKVTLIKEDLTIVQIEDTNGIQTNFAWSQCLIRHTGEDDKIYISSNLDNSSKYKTYGYYDITNDTLVKSLQSFNEGDCTVISNSQRQIPVTVEMETVGTQTDRNIAVAYWIKEVS